LYASQGAWAIIYICLHKYSLKNYMMIALLSINIP
jgi:hypothetical protein